MIGAISLEGVGANGIQLAGSKSPDVGTISLRRRWQREIFDRRRCSEEDIFEVGVGGMQGICDDAVRGTRKDGKDHCGVFYQTRPGTMPWPVTPKAFANCSNPDDSLVHKTYGIHSASRAWGDFVTLLRHKGIGRLC
jgi:hypothetical protein